MYLTKEPLYGNGKAKFILVKNDGIEGMKVFKTILKIYCKEQTNVALFSYDGSAEAVLHGLEVNREKIKILDIFSDPYAWYKAENLDALLSVDFIVENFYDFKGVLCIYSLTSLLIHNGVDKVYKMIHKFLNTNNDLHILAFLNSDVHSAIDCFTVEALSTTNLCICRAETIVSTVRNSSGKVNFHYVEYKISENFELLSLVDIQLQKKIEEKKPDPTANLTFNLRLKDEEKEAKSQLQLPYMKKQTSDDTIIQNLLENDFYDEEDPDDDLDI